MRATAVLFLATLLACNQQAANDKPKPAPAPPVKVDLVAVDEGPTPETLTLTGMIAADQRSEVTADTAGKVLAVMVERGQRVKMGDPVVRIDVRSAALSAREAQANLASARAQKALAEEECKRAQTLLDKGAITRSEYDRQTTQCTSSLQQVAAAQARSEMIAKSVADGLVRAPFEGLVADRHVTPGEWVAPGRPLFTLVDDDPLKIELSVPESAVRAIQNGQRVTLTAVAVPCFLFTAIVTRVGAEIGRTRALIVEATIDPKVAPEAIDTPSCKEQPSQPPQLVAGMFAEARVTIGQKRRAIVPATAVTQRGKIWHAFVAIDGELHDKIVLTGPSGSPGTVAIVRGELKKGDRVANAITPDLVDGVRVEGGAGVAPAAIAPAGTPPEAPNPTPSTGSSR